jgi:GNAT superfamily N-acetyltransferase
LTPKGLAPVEVLASRHDRSAFSCGNEALDRYLQQQVGQDVRRHFAAAFVLCAPGTTRVIAYYTLSALAVPAEGVAAARRRRLPYPEVPAALIGRLAVDRDHQGQGLGGVLLMDAAARCGAADRLAVWALVVDPVDDEARGFYRHHGFVDVIGRTDRMVLPLDTLREALERGRHNDD